MRLYIPLVLEIYPYKNDATNIKVAEELIKVLDGLSLAQPDKAYFYSIKTSSFMVYEIIS